MKPKQSGAVRLFVWQPGYGPMRGHASRKTAQKLASLTGGTYLGEYIARPVKAKKPAKKKGAKRAK